jgi:hypothetical protein
LPPPTAAAVERLDLALLIYREDDGVGGRIDIETDMLLAAVSGKDLTVG